MYHSIIIEESLENPRILDNYNVLKTQFIPKENWHWHIIEINNLEASIKDIQQNMLSDKPYYSHIYDDGNTLIVIYKNRVFELDPNHESTWQEARKYGASQLNIPVEQLDFYPCKISQETA